MLTILPWQCCGGALSLPFALELPDSARLCDPSAQRPPDYL
jgi:hypothetical protein